MILGYNTNGFAHHAPQDAMEVLASIGYRAVALTIDHGVLNPRDAALGDQPGRLRRVAKKLGLTIVVETGGRYLLDPWMKHEPTLVSTDADKRASRVAFYEQAIDVAQELGAVCVSLWSGVLRDDAPAGEAWERLVAGMKPVLEHAHRCAMPVAFEPEPGMFVATLADYRELKERLAASGVVMEPLRLTIDIGHLHCNGETPLADEIERHAADLANVHLEDMRAGVHEHLPFGEGEIDFTEVMAALKRITYTGPACVELSRHSHDAPRVARAAYDFLTSFD
ncbi:sugar phosphate isomerase/epimerase family protein [Botrimarina mediterranea]|uniref:L-ribulose-5-phosphate 3-epimerase UlaE n=1 Tax=Botrimarina mediterranea TaxID=2528022 RepID=A0A518KBI9_9BACT|nr:sugar phosphate isomerase/epimerase family protein [Botrimarina mediterranea]QDV75155.1 L-ribulose-5-phosphate 3-epimerase UlaE [Botrimarina mediterranea]QDV79801.1 L-ribulose-5-phosphate 3-epimerase UlaE [Planctomycetes bacterium K2D]